MNCLKYQPSLLSLLHLLNQCTGRKVVLRGGGDPERPSADTSPPALGLPRPPPARGTPCSPPTPRVSHMPALAQLTVLAVRNNGEGTCWVRLPFIILLLPFLLPRFPACLRQKMDQFPSLSELSAPTADSWEDANLS